MREYCNCQSLPAIAALIGEHDQVTDLIADTHEAYRQGDVGAMVTLCEQMSAVLQPHTVVEEKGLFPAMALEFPEQIAILQSEHRRIEAVLAGATDGTVRVDPAWPTRVIEAMSLLRRHIAKEQDGVFHAAVSILSNEQWNRLGEIRQALKLVSS